MILVLVTILLAVAADQLTKYWIAGFLPELEGRTFPLIRNVLYLTYSENPGAAFGILSSHRWVFMVLSVAGMALIAFLLLKGKPESRWNS